MASLPLSHQESEIHTWHFIAQGTGYIVVALCLSPDFIGIYNLSSEDVLNETPCSAFFYFTKQP